MPIFSINNNKEAKKILLTSVALERDIQNLFEKNLKEILDINFLSSEYITRSGGRIDTLGIDNNGSPVIIEYKRTQNDSVINQGLYYLRWLLDHKAEFDVLVRKINTTIEIDWSSPRVICIAESYNKFDLDAVELLPMNIELLHYRLYAQDILLVEPEAHSKVKVSTAEIFDKNEKRQQEYTFKEKLKHTTDEHLAVASEVTKKLFLSLKEKIVALDESIIEEPKAKYIAYKLTTNFIDIVVYKDSIKIFLNMPSGTLNDPLKLTRDLAKPKIIGHWGNGDYEVKLEKKDDLDTVMALIQQSYKYNS